MSAASDSRNVQRLLRERFSPKAFDAREIGDVDLMALFEAARWAPSCYNDQPWRFVLARRGSAAHAALLTSLTTGNQRWACTAPLLVLCAARRCFAHDGRPNRHAWYDLGQAVSNLLTCASALGLHAHQMAGFDAAGAARALGVPDDHDAVVVCALGYRGDPACLPEDVIEKNPAARERHALDAIVSDAQWSSPWPAAQARTAGE